MGGPNIYLRMVLIQSILYQKTAKRLPGLITIVIQILMGAENHTHIIGMSSFAVVMGSE
jgi:hypothetical protein